MNPVSSSAIAVQSLSEPLDETASARLAELLPEYIASQRWFRAKARRIKSVEVGDVLSMPSASAQILVLRIDYADGESDRYLLPVSIGRGDAENGTAVVARLLSSAGEEGVLFSALDNAQFREKILEAMICQETVEGRSGLLVAERTPALDEECAGAARTSVESFVSRAEQSNTSIIYRDHYILKLFRKLETGINPDLEIGEFLTTRGFANTPAVLGSISYRTEAPKETAAVAILQQFVPNQGDAWKFTLESLSGCLESALGSGQLPAPRPSEHPLDLTSQPVPHEIGEYIGAYLGWAALLGVRTAQMHAALTPADAVSDFAPEKFGAEDSRQLQRDLIDQADSVFELLRGKLGSLNGPTGEDARRLLGLEAQIRGRFDAIEGQPVSAVRIRHHGDYHLGQVLFTGRDFMIIDFEGEPARPLAARRIKALALRDVAGMVRSFQYAAFAALFGQVSGITSDPSSHQLIEAWAEAWNAYVSSTFLRAYFDAAHEQPFVPPDVAERRLLLDAFLLQKALYELAYEVNNRPAWLPIPLRGILSLVG